MRPRLIDPYRTYLAERWNQGVRRGSQLEKEVRARGYTGSQRAMYRYLETLSATAVPQRVRRRAQTAARAETGSPQTALQALSAGHCTWLFFRRRADLKQEEQGQLDVLLQASPKAKMTYDLVEAFLKMVRERTGEDQLDVWLKEVEASQLEAFPSFVTSIQQDKDAVMAGLTLPWSTGPLEGHINRLKLMKRQGYGRAKFDLLRLRVLHHPRKKQGVHQQRADPLSREKTRGNSQNFQHITFPISRVDTAGEPPREACSRGAQKTDRNQRKRTSAALYLLCAIHAQK